MLLRAMVAAEDPAVRRRLAALLAGVDVVAEEERLRRGTPLRALMQRGPDLLVLHRADLGGRLAAAIRRLPRADDLPAIVVVAEHEDPGERAALLAAGCEAVLYLGLSDDALRGALEALVRRRRERASQVFEESQRARPCLADFASESTAMRTLVEMALKVVDSDTTLLIQGETGVGKEWLARAVHAEGKRARGPFVAVNCAALPEPLLESELFGHEAGAFTGATKARRGAFEMAHKGTIFLDEIGEMPLHLQVKLLRVLQDHCVQRVGAEKAVALDVRVMAASNRDLLEAVKTRTFRQDLYYRLGVVTLTVPPLRERREDIDALAESYVDDFRRRLGRPVEGLAREALQAIRAYAWPGNVRELINVIERAVLLCGEPRITLQHLPAGLAQTGRTGPPGRLLIETDGSASLRLVEDWRRRPLSDLRREVVDELEREYLAGILREERGQIARAAERAGLNARSLYAKMRRHGLKKEAFR